MLRSLTPVNALLLLALATPLAACGSPDQPAGQVLPTGAVATPSQRASSPASPRPSATPGTPSPLTGLPVPAAVAARPAVAVPVVLTSSRTPVGVEAADVVFEEIAEPGLVRLVTLFQTRDPERVGPVGPTRPVDGKLLTASAPLVVYAGGTSGFVSQLDRNLRGVSSVTRPDMFTTDPSWPAPYSRSVQPARCRALSGGLTAPPPAFDFGPDSAARASAAPGASAATGVALSAAGHATQSWRYDPAARLWRGQLGPLRATVTSLVVLSVPYKQVTAKGRTTPTADVYGSGAATTFVGGRALRGQWFKPGGRGVLNVVDGTSAPVRLPPGRTWVVLAPTGTRMTVT